MTVQTDFKLVDTINNRDWEHYSPRPYVATDRTGASPLFGASRTEADLTPRDRIVAGLVQRGVKAFICRLLPCRITVSADVASSVIRSLRQFTNFPPTLRHHPSKPA